MSFEGKVVIITGSGRGLGKCLAKMFLGKGAKVTINDRVADRLNNVKKEFAEYKDNCLFVLADIGKEEEAKSLIEQTINVFGKIDVLVNNASVVYDRKFEEHTTSEFDDTYSSNLKGTFLCSRFAAPYLRETKGNIVNVSSTNGIDTLYTWSMDYDATKAAIINLTQNLADELAPDVRVNAIAPRWINTDMNKELPKEVIDEESDKILMKRFGEPEEFAKVILFLASDEAGYVTRSIIRVGD